MKSFSWSAKGFARTQSHVWLGLLSVLALSGCNKEQIEVYRIPKEPSAMAANPHGSGGMPNPHATAAGAHADLTGPQIQYQKPAAWEERPLGGMRAAHFAATNRSGQRAEISAIPLPGARASTAQIVNMWREQIKLEAMPESELAKAGEQVAIGSAQGQLFDLESTEPLIDGKYHDRILAAVLKMEGVLWAFKMSGEAGVVGDEKPNFLSFLKSVRFDAATQADTQTGPAMAAAASPGEATQKATWDAPSNWKQVPATMMLLAKFMVTGENNAQAEITVSSFPGDVGGMLANVNRWRGQVGLSPVDEAEMKKEISSIDVMGGQASVVDLKGPKMRVIGAIVPRGSQTWFYKMTGDEQLAGQEKASFIKFVQSVRYPADAGI